MPRTTKKKKPRRKSAKGPAKKVIAPRVERLERRAAQGQNSREPTTGLESTIEELEQRIAEGDAALRASQCLIQSVLDATADAVITIDADGIVQSFNAGAEGMFGYSAGEIIGRNVNTLMGSPYREHHDEYLRRYRETREPHIVGGTRQLRARRRDGTEFAMQLSVDAIPELQHFTGIVRDITEQRELQEEIVRIATQEQRRIGQELHDATLQELTGLSLLARNLSEVLDSAEHAKERELAARLAAGIADTHRRVRWLARGLVPVNVGAESLMEALRELARSTESEHGIPCRFECPDPVRITDDSIALHLYRIAQEAVTNAAKHAQAHLISLRLEGADGEVKLEVTDDGIGLQVQQARGNGLGLRIMEHRCGLLGGTFSARKRTKGGTVLCCRIPAASER